MKKLINLTLTLLFFLSITPVKAIEVCGDISSNVEHCHEEENSSPSEKHEHKDCGMVCCHISLTEMKLPSILIESIELTKVKVPPYKAGAVMNSPHSLFRPPIS